MKKNIKNNRAVVKIVIYCIVLFLATFLLSVNTLANKFAFDDKGLIQDNRFIREGTTLKEIFSTNYRYGVGTPDDGLYRPLVMLTYVVNAKSANLNPLPYHFSNIILNAIISVLLFLLLYFLTGNLIVSFLSALFYSFHPIHTEVVANIAGRPELMCVCFIFLSWITLERINNPFSANIIASILLLLALFSKETAVMMPFMVFASDFARKRPIKDNYAIVKYSALVLTVLLYLVIRWSFLGDTATGNVPRFYDNPIANSPLQIRVATALGVLLRYLMLLVFPCKLSSDYSYNTLPLYDSVFRIVPLTAIFISSLFIGISLYYRKRNNIYLLSGIFFFFPYIIVSNIFFSIGTIMGERLMYLPSAGFSLILGSTVAYILNKRRYYALLIIFVILLLYSAKTLSRNRDWYDDFTLTRVDLHNFPNNVKLLANMAYHTAKNKQFQQAEEYYTKALEIYPEFTDGLTGIGKILYDQNLFDESLKYYSRAKNISPEDPQIQFDYAAVLIKAGRFVEAEIALHSAMKKIPHSPILFRGMGNLMLARKNYREAIYNYEKAFELGGKKLFLLNNMTLAFYYMGELERALHYVQIAESLGIQLNPDMVRSIKAEVYSH